VADLLPAHRIHPKIKTARQLGSGIGVVLATAGTLAAVLALWVGPVGSPWGMLAVAPGIALGWPAYRAPVPGYVPG
jgi:hypothetical protein